jgi:hypothetical protein
LAVVGEMFCCVRVVNNSVFVQRWACLRRFSSGLYNRSFVGDAHGHGPYPITNSERTLLSAWLKQGRDWLML